MHKRKRIARDVERRIIWRPFTIRKSSTKPIHIIKAQDEKLFDSKGKEYLDLISSWWVSIHGHRDANIIAAIKKQLNKFDQILFTDFSHTPASNLAQRITEIMPNSLCRVFFF